MYRQLLKHFFHMVLKLIDRVSLFTHYSTLHCVKRVQKRSYYWSVFPCIRTPNTGKYGPEITPYLDTFHAVYILAITRPYTVQIDIAINTIVKFQLKYFGFAKQYLL